MIRFGSEPWFGPRFRAWEELNHQFSSRFRGWVILQMHSEWVWTKPDPNKHPSPPFVDCHSFTMSFMIIAFPPCFTSLGFYVDDIVFEGTMARCSWEAGINITSRSQIPSLKMMALTHHHINSSRRNPGSSGAETSALT